MRIIYDLGLMDTNESLDRAHIAHAGSGANLEKARAPAIFERKGMKFGFFR